MAQQGVTAIFFNQDFFQKLIGKSTLAEQALKEAPDEAIDFLTEVQNGVDIVDLAKLAGVNIPDDDDDFDPNVLVEQLNGLLESFGIPSQIGNFIKITGRDSRLGPDIVKDSIFEVVPFNLNYSYGWSSEDIPTKMKNQLEWVNIEGIKFPPKIHEGLEYLREDGEADI